MAKSLSSLIETFERLWPVSGAEDWDRPGLTTGSPHQNISKVLMSVDVTLAVLEQAKTLGCELIVSHHPLLLKGVSFLPESTLKGEVISYAIKNEIALYSAHTNADIVVGGVSDVLAQALGLRDTRALVETGADIGHGRIGRLPSKLNLAEFALAVSELMPQTNAPIRVAGDLQKEISVVAVVGGAGDSFISAAQAEGADCLVTSDLRHHVSLDAISDPSNPLALMDVSHFAGESLWLKPTANTLSQLVPEVEFIVSEISTDPWSMSIPGKSNREG